MYPYRMPRHNAPLSKEEIKRRTDIIVKECDGISPPFRAFYIDSIIYTAQASDDAFERFANAVRKDRSSDYIVSSVQEALTHAAALSRFFWPSRRTNLTEARAQNLRNIFEMNNSVLEDRDLRNAIEHFDERLDLFLLADPVGYFFPGPLVDDHTLADEPPGQIFRLVDPYAAIFIILGEKYEFLAIREEVHRILKRARQLS